MKPVILRGRETFSAFRAEALLKDLQQADPELNIDEITAVNVYFLQLDKQVQQVEQVKSHSPYSSISLAQCLQPHVLKEIFNLLKAEGELEERGGFFIIPRKGTISPWSSKATDIFHNCGLSSILRVERGIYYKLFSSGRLLSGLHDIQSLLPRLHDRMVEGVYTDVSDIFREIKPAPIRTIDILSGGEQALASANIEMGLALSDDEIEYFFHAYDEAGRNPTDVELVMFGQVNSEHCRHKIFNAAWIIDGKPQPHTLFDMIRNTHEKHPQGTLLAYSDNAAIIKGSKVEAFNIIQQDNSNIYKYSRTQLDRVIKVETHNHPTAISPFPSAATGIGGEIRDEAATGTGGKTKAGLAAFMVSNLRIPGFNLPWEKEYSSFPAGKATPLEIMLKGPIGASRFGNEFGRPQLCGIFKTYEEFYNARYRGYHKPIMVAGGMGHIKRVHSHKNAIPAKALILQIGGPALKIGLGGGAASSMAAGSNIAELDFNSVQRGNAEMERRCQEVVDRCAALEGKNPILSIHDLGAGGLSNGCPELVADSGAEFHLRKIPNEDLSMSPMEIWCCEAQERYVLAIKPEALKLFRNICERERCPVAVIGTATGDRHLSLFDEYFGNKPIDVDIGVILGKPPRVLKRAKRLMEKHAQLSIHTLNIGEVARRILHLPAVANKTFLITIADRSVTGLVARDQMVGPYQTPIADVAVTATSYTTTSGEAMAMGEYTNLALVSAPASGRMAVGEAITNIAAANIGSIESIKLSANWMCGCGEETENVNLYDTVHAVGVELCPKLGISIPVGKDSLSMRTLWQGLDGKQEKMIAPLSLIVSAFAPVKDVRKTVTPDLKPGKSILILIELGLDKNRPGCSALAQVYNQLGKDHPDLGKPELLVCFFNAIQELVEKKLLMAYHDRSDGGLFVTLAEMAFGGRMGIQVALATASDKLLSVLFAEELGAVLQVAEKDLKKVSQILKKHSLKSISYIIGQPSVDKRLKIFCDEGSEPLRMDRDLSGMRDNLKSFLHRGANKVYDEKISILQRQWSELTFHMQKVRDNPACAQAEYDNLLDESDPGMKFKLTFDPHLSSGFSKQLKVNSSIRRPKVAILREQGVNGHVEMAAAFNSAGFECHDVHMTDLFAKRVLLTDFIGLIACGGFSYGDVLGAGSGWAMSILFNQELKCMFKEFFERQETFTLGVCNGCQMLSQLKKIISGAESWPEFTVNQSEQFEARYITAEILNSRSIFFKDMAGSLLGIPVAHGEGYANFERTGSLEALKKNNLLAVRYVDNYSRPTERYPFNPNGSPEGITGLTTPDGRVTIMMPHPERGFRSVQMSYRPGNMFDNEEGPWLKMFRNAREFVG